MSLALYRKYRPQTFAELVGQNHIKVTLQNELATGKTAHAYLFSGPRGLGKTTIARLMAKSVNCLKRKAGESEPCNECESCLEIKEGRSLDVVEIDAASHTGVDNVRENIIANARFTPTNRKFKVFIIDEVHMLSLSAFNALLKTLEEPPSHAMFILATTEIHKIPETIISRCQHFEFRKVASKDLAERLAQIAKQEKKTVETEVLTRIAAWSEGGVRDAESLLGQLLSLDEKKITTKHAELILPSAHYDLVFEFIGAILKNQTTESLILVNKLVQDGVDLNHFLFDVIEVTRKLMFAKISGDLEQFTVELTGDWEKEIKNLLNLASVQKFGGMIEIFIRAQREIKSAEIIQLPLELAVVEIINGKDDNASNSSNSGNAGGTTVTPPVLTKTQKSAKNNDVTPPKEVIIEGENNTIIETVSVSVAPVEASASTEPVRMENMDFDITLEVIKSKWEAVLDRLKNYNQSLASTLKHHGPTAVKPDGYVEISFKYKFYQQRVNDVKNRTLVETILQEVYGLPLRIQTVIDKNIASVAPTTNKPVQEEMSGNNLDNLVQAFGGQLVE